MDLDDAYSRHRWASIDFFESRYPWAVRPVLIGAPMRNISGPDLAVGMSRAGGIGFLGAGECDDEIRTLVTDARRVVRNRPSPMFDTSSALPVGIGLLLNGPDSLMGQDDEPPTQLAYLVEQLRAERPPAAVWLFGWRNLEMLQLYVEVIRNESAGRTDVWIQVGTVAAAQAVIAVAEPDVIVAQGSDAGGHGLRHSASLLTLLPELIETIYSDSNLAVVNSHVPRRPVIVGGGGITTSRAAQAAGLLGAGGIVLGTALLACPEARISNLYRKAVIEATDGGRTTRKSRLFDCVRGSPAWPRGFVGRGRVSRMYWHVKADAILSESETESGDRAATWQPSPEEDDWIDGYGSGTGNRIRQASQRFLEAAANEAAGEVDWDPDDDVPPGAPTGPNEWLIRYMGTGVGLVQDMEQVALLADRFRREMAASLRTV